MTFEDFCAFHNIVVVYHNFSTKIRGLCIKQGDQYIVGINPKFCNGMQKKTFQHEIMHIMQNHFSCDPCDIDKCENEVDLLMKDYNSNFNCDKYYDY